MVGVSTRTGEERAMSHVDHDELRTAPPDERARRRRQRRWPEPPVHEVNLSRFACPARSALVAGAVAWAHVGYADGSGSKARPVVVVARHGRSVVVVPVSSSPSSKRQPDALRLTEPARGITRDSVVLLRPKVVDVLAFYSVTGQVDPGDAGAIHAGLARAPEIAAACPLSRGRTTVATTRVAAPHRVWTGECAGHRR
jgi:hypothetical protein